MRECTVEGARRLVTGQLPDGRWIVGINFVTGVVQWCEDDAVHPDNPRPGPLAFLPADVELT